MNAGEVKMKGNSPSIGSDFAAMTESRTRAIGQQQQGRAMVPHAVPQPVESPAEQQPVENYGHRTTR
jgi:hypothetical protein